MAKKLLHHSFLVEICYQGHLFQGWQWQGGQSLDHRSVHGEIKKRLAPFAHTILGQSRTDSGVSAKSFFMRLKIITDQEQKNVFDDLCLHLVAQSDDALSFLRIADFPYKFDLIGGMEQKTYRYCWQTTKNKDYPWLLTWETPLNFDLIQEAMTYLESQKNFYYFQNQGVTPEQATRSITLKLEQHDNELFSLAISCKGFMRGMCRYLVGFLFNIGSQQYTFADFDQWQKILPQLPVIEDGQLTNRPKRFKVPGNGLVLERTEYSKLTEVVWYSLAPLPCWVNDYRILNKIR